MKRNRVTHRRRIEYIRRYYAMLREKHGMNCNDIAISVRVSQYFMGDYDNLSPEKRKYLQENG